MNFTFLPSSSLLIPSLSAMFIAPIRGPRPMFHAESPARSAQDRYIMTTRWKSFSPIWNSCGLFSIVPISAGALNSSGLDSLQLRCASGVLCLFSSALLCNRIPDSEVLYALEHDDPFKNRHAGKSRRRAENSGTRSILLQVLRTGWQSQL